MKKFMAAAAATGLLLIGAAAPASAETLSRTKGKATITAQGAPEGAVVTKARVTVKKAKKTVAKNKKSYKANKGKYTVTSTVSYYFPGYDSWTPGTTSTSPATTKTVKVLESDMAFEECTVTGRTISNRTVQAVDYDSYWQEATVRGQAAITYTGICTAEIESQGYVKHSWTDEWTELENVFDPSVGMTYGEYVAFNPQTWLNRQLANNGSPFYPHLLGDVVYYPGNGSELDNAGWITVTVPGQTTTTSGYWTTGSATPVTTVKSTRTVVVK